MARIEEQDPEEPEEDSDESDPGDFEGDGDAFNEDDSF